jgi:phenylacetic acid degradation operon negative regulatory protein
LRDKAIHFCEEAGMTDSQLPVAERRSEDPCALEGAIGRLGDGLRAGSLAVSFLGDCIVPRGGGVGVAAISQVLAAFGVDAGVTRTSMSRLASDGWVGRQKVGRNSFYALTPSAIVASETASRRIYASRHSEAPCGWRIVYAGGLGKNEQTSLRAALKRRGAAELAAQTYLLPAGDDPPDAAAAITMTSGPLSEADARLLVARAFDLVALGQDYATFVAAFAPVRDSLGTGRKLAGLDALAMRVFVVHAFRRIVLRDPMIPAPYLPDGWPGLAARATFAAIWRTLLRPSEAWLDAVAASAYGPLPPRSALPTVGASRRSPDR